MPPSQTYPANASDPLSMPLSARRPATLGPFLVASDGGESSVPALVVARLLAAQGEPHVVSVLEPMPMMMPPAEVPVYSIESDERRAEAQATLLREQVRGVFGEALPGMEVLVGRPIALLARLARERRASLVITGLRHHGRLDRMMLHRETPLGIARESRLPVLAVPPGTRRLPRTVVVAVDLDAASVTAARKARPLLAEAEKVYLVHVRGTGNAPSAETVPAWERLYDRLTSSTFERITAALGLPAGAIVETRVLAGHPVEELLDFAEFARAELIVSGYHRRMLLDRLTGPRSVAERVFRGATCAMLLVPEAEGMELPVGTEATTETIADRVTWAAELDAFARRNVGRVARLEVDTLDIGSQAQVGGYPLLGIEYDAPARTIRMMFGRLAGGAPHMTHNVPDPASLEIQRSSDGRDLALRVMHEGGYSLLMLD